MLSRRDRAGTITLGEREVIVMGSKGKRYSARFRFQVVLEVLKGDRNAVRSLVFMTCIQSQ